jgi:hypothetical protein
MPTGNMDGFRQLTPPPPPLSRPAVVGAPAVLERIDLPWPINVRLELRYSIETCVGIVCAALAVFVYINPFDTLFALIDSAIDRIMPGPAAAAGGGGAAGEGQGGRGGKGGGKGGGNRSSSSSAVAAAAGWSSAKGIKFGAAGGAAAAAAAATRAP